MVGLLSDDRTCARTEFGCGTSFAKRCSGMVRAQLDVVRQEHLLGLRLNFCNVVITPVACLAAGHRNYTQGMCEGTTLKCEKKLRRMVPPPVEIDWSAPWHVILHSWHARIDTVLHQFAFLPWSAVVTIKHWKFAAYIKTLPRNMVATLFRLDATRDVADLLR